MFAVLFFTGCLTCEYKEYKFEFTGKNSGTLTIKYKNIISQKDDKELTAREEVESDYRELIDKYILGTSIEEEYPEAKVLSKKLYEENNQLCAEVVLSFEDISNVNIYKIDKKSPFMLNLGSQSYMGLQIENYFDSNGDLGPAYFPVVMWSSKSKILELTTTITTPDEESISLLNTWKKDELNKTEE